VPFCDFFSPKVNAFTVNYFTFSNKMSPVGGIIKKCIS
jgi:hypothetical protein